MKIIVKVLFLVFACLILSACPGSSYTRYKLIGSNTDIPTDYEKIVLNKSDTIFAQVGVLHQYINDKKTYLIVKFKESPDVELNVASTKFGNLKSDAQFKNIYKTEIRSQKKSDTVIISYGTNRYYFTPQ